VRCFEYGKRFAAKMRADTISRIVRKKKAQVRAIRFQERDAPHVVRSVSRDDAQPGVEQVVALLEEVPIVDRESLHHFGRLTLEHSVVLAIRDERERAQAKEVAVHLEFRQRVTELVNGCCR
jgi:hypothetical protein